jgi:hypothetical protein
VSFHHTNWLTANSKVDDPVTLLIMKTIADRADKLTGRYSVDDATLAQACRTTVRSILRHKKMFPADEIKIVVKGGSWKGQRRERSVYKLLNREKDPTTGDKLTGVTGDKLSGVNGTDRRQSDQYRRQDVTPIDI